MTKRKLTPAEKTQKKNRQMEYMTIFINGKQKRVKRPPIIVAVPLLVLTLCLFGGCASREMSSVIASWQYQPVNDVIAAWGTPSEELITEEKRLLIWTTYDGILAPPEAKRAPTPTEVGYCLRLLEVGRNGRIIHGAWEGDDCPGLFSGWGR